MWIRKDWTLTVCRHSDLLNIRKLQKSRRSECSLGFKSIICSIYRHIVFGRLEDNALTFPFFLRFFPTAPDGWRIVTGFLPCRPPARRHNSSFSGAEKSRAFLRTMSPSSTIFGLKNLRAELAAMPNAIARMKAPRGSVSMASLSAFGSTGIQP